MEKDRYPSEETMWGLFHCLALSALVMFQGSENLSTFRWNREIVHFDLKQENCKIILTSKLACEMLTFNISVDRSAGFRY